MTPIQREEDRLLLEEIASYKDTPPTIRFGRDDWDSRISPWNDQGKVLTRLFDNGLVAPRTNTFLFNPRTTSIGGPEAFVLTPSGEEYLEQLHSDTRPHPSSKRVFITHGKDRSYLTDATRVCHNMGFETEVAILEPNDSQTIEDKIRRGIDRADAVLVLLTNDDGQPSYNAVMELGHARLQRKHVILFVEPGVALPTNLGGVAHRPLAGQWTLDLGDELSAIR